jgi:hypothetical protein
VLFFGKPRDQIGAKINAKTSPILITVGGDGKRAFVVLESIVNRTLEISKDLFGCCEMNGGGRMHVLAELVH